MTTLRDKLIENNNKINWYPDNIRTGRFGKFLENVIDLRMFLRGDYIGRIGKKEEKEDTERLKGKKERDRNESLLFYSDEHENLEDRLFQIE